MLKRYLAKFLRDVLPAYPQPPAPIVLDFVTVTAALNRVEAELQSIDNRLQLIDKSNADLASIERRRQLQAGQPVD